MSEILKRLWVKEQGQGMAEYAFILALVAMMVIGALGALGTAISNKYLEVEAKFPE